MPFHKQRRYLLDEAQATLALQIKADIARAIRHHPHLTGEDSTRAYEQLADERSVNRIIAELAREEADAAKLRGEMPALALVHMANFEEQPVLN